MRIIGGSAAGLSIQVPDGFDVRPTPDLVRQAIFNSLGSRVDGTDVLELFAGSGALSLECLSRGAKHAVCIEKSPKHASFIRRNLEAIHLSRNVMDIRVNDAFAGLSQLVAAGQSFDLILADPPYGEKNVGRRSTSFAQKLLDEKLLPKILRPGGILILGHTKRDTLEIPAVWQEKKLLKHGDTVIRFFEVMSPGIADPTKLLGEPDRG